MSLGGGARSVKRGAQGGPDSWGFGPEGEGRDPWGFGPEGERDHGGQNPWTPDKVEVHNYYQGCIVAVSNY